MHFVSSFYRSVCVISNRIVKLIIQVVDNSGIICPTSVVRVLGTTPLHQDKERLAKDAEDVFIDNISNITSFLKVQVFFFEFQQAPVTGGTGVNVLR